MAIKLTIALLIGAIASSAALAQDRIDTTLLAQGDWSVSDVIFPEDHVSDTCYAETVRGEQSLTFYGYTYDFLSVVVWDNRWAIGSRPVNFTITAGSGRWPVEGYANDTNISYDFLSLDESQSFMNDVATGNLLIFTADNGNKLADFSLSGSSAAMLAFADCWARIRASDDASADPFAATSNTASFGGTLTDSNDVVYTVSLTGEGVGTLLESTNMRNGDHESFGLYNDCVSFSFRHGYGNWYQINGGFEMVFADANFVFPEGMFQVNGETNC